MKKYSIYYRDLPSSLDYFIHLDEFMGYTKDGVKTFQEHKCPRLSLYVEPTGNVSLDKDRINKLEALLLNLLSNNQIVGYS